MRKSYFSIPVILAMAVSISLLSCNNKQDYFEVSKPAGESVVFSSKAQEGAKLVEVNSSSPWSARVDQPWVNIEYRNNGINVSVDPNRTVRQRKAVITILTDNATETVNVTQDPGKARVITIDPVASIGQKATYVSDNGKYIIGWGEQSTFIAEITEDVVDSIKTSTVYPNTYKSITNTGVLCEWATSGDGAVIASMERGRYSYDPYIISYGTKMALPCPEVDMSGSKNYLGNMPLAVSNDKKYILGRHVTTMGTWIEASWRLENGMYVFHTCPEEEVEFWKAATMKYPSWPVMSANGKYIGGINVDGNDKANNQIPYMRDVEAGGKMILLYGFQNYKCPSVSDAGHAFLALPTGSDPYSRETTVYDLNLDEETPFPEWLKNNYYITDEEAELARVASVEAINQDMSVIVWHAYDKSIVNYALVVE